MNHPILTEDSIWSIISNSKSKQISKLLKKVTKPHGPIRAMHLIDVFFSIQAGMAAGILNFCPEKLQEKYLHIAIFTHFPGFIELTESNWANAIKEFINTDANIQFDIIEIGSDYDFYDQFNDTDTWEIPDKSIKHNTKHYDILDNYFESPDFENPDIVFFLHQDSETFLTWVRDYRELIEDYLFDTSPSVIGMTTDQLDLEIHEVIVTAFLLGNFQPYLNTFNSSLSDFLIRPSILGRHLFHIDLDVENYTPPKIQQLRKNLERIHQLNILISEHNEMATFPHLIGQLIHDTDNTYIVGTNDVFMDYLTGKAYQITDYDGVTLFYDKGEPLFTPRNWTPPKIVQLDSPLKIIEFVNEKILNDIHNDENPDSHFNPATTSIDNKLNELFKDMHTAVVMKHIEWRNKYIGENGNLKQPIQSIEPWVRDCICIDTKEEQANANYAYHFSLNPFFQSVWNDNPAKIIEYLKNGANPNALDSAGLTPLHIAAFRNSTKAIEILIKHGSNINQLSKNGVTPFLYALRYHATEAQMLLHQFGADTHIQPPEMSDEMRDHIFSIIDSNIVDLFTKLDPNMAPWTKH